MYGRKCYFFASNIEPSEGFETEVAAGASAGYVGRGLIKKDGD
jgi:hypothetical protein